MYAIRSYYEQPVCTKIQTSKKSPTIPLFIFFIQHSSIFWIKQIQSITQMQVICICVIDYTLSKRRNQWKSVMLLFTALSGSLYRKYVITSYSIHYTKLYDVSVFSFISSDCSDNSVWFCWLLLSMSSVRFCVLSERSILLPLTPVAGKASAKNTGRIV